MGVYLIKGGGFSDWNDMSHSLAPHLKSNKVNM